MFTFWHKKYKNLKFTVLLNTVLEIIAKNRDKQLIIDVFFAGEDNSTRETASVWPINLWRGDFSPKLQRERTPSLLFRAECHSKWFSRQENSILQSCLHLQSPYPSKFQNSHYILESISFHTCFKELFKKTPLKYILKYCENLGRID